MNEKKKNYLNLSKAKECKNNNKKLINDWQKYTHTHTRRERKNKKTTKIFKNNKSFQVFSFIILNINYKINYLYIWIEVCIFQNRN